MSVTPPAAPPRPAADPPPLRTCRNCVHAVEGVCVYVNRGNSPDGHCGQHRFPVEPWMTRENETW